MPESVTVSVVIPAYCAGATLESAVESALRQPEVGRVLVVVAPSPDSTDEVAERLRAREPARVEVHRNPDRRTSTALNIGFAATDAQVVVRLDAHVRLPEGYVGRALRVLKETGAANVGGLQVPVSSGGFSAGVASAMRSAWGSGGATYRVGGNAGPVDTVYLGVFRREAVLGVGGFDPRFVRNQDAELNCRLREAGFAVWFDPALAVAYRPRDTIRALAKQYFDYGRYRRLTVREHPDSFRARQLAAPLLVVALVVASILALLLRRPTIAVAPGLGYLGSTGLAALRAAHPPAAAPQTFAAFVVMHLAWGLGFLIGPPSPAGPVGQATEVET